MSRNPPTCKQRHKPCVPDSGTAKCRKEGLSAGWNDRPGAQGLGCHDAVAALVLGQIQRLISPLDQRLGLTHHRVTRRHADTHRHVEGLPLPRLPGEMVGISDAGISIEPHPAAIGKQDDQLIAALGIELVMLWRLDFEKDNKCNSPSRRKESPRTPI